MGIIYMYTNIVNGKQYIGQTKKSIEQRAGSKLSGYTTGSNTGSKFSRAIRKYGYDKFVCSIIHTDIPDELLNDYEMLYIELYSTFELGYNSTTGGNAPTVFSKERNDAISKALKGLPKSKETKKKISAANKGKLLGTKHPLFGKHRSAEVKSKLSEANKGKEISGDTKKKMSESRKGIVFSEEHRKKLSDANKGENNPMFGKHLTEDHKRKISAGLKGIKRSEETRKKLSEANKGHNNPMFGKHLTEEHKHKMSESLKGRKHKGKTVIYDNIEFDSVRDAYNYALSHGYVFKYNKFYKDLVKLKELD